ncbi:hypothetical protein CK203_026736 [Vitis vinifera]|uniref:Retrovirus-related Pol polyprotein from transposon TNT 1-94 n=1 Tax=Vitis vinifera TaxID=29760 RepID=A0A438IU52_VITVI|nr:hypothetical protein CK203_026736 [Vitis vinifera]
MLKMKETETIKDYSDTLLGIVNKVRLLGIRVEENDKKRRIDGGALQAKAENTAGDKTRKTTIRTTTTRLTSQQNKDGTYPPCPHCKRQITHKGSVGGGLTSSAGNVVRLDTWSGFASLKYITDVLYVPNIDQNLLSVGQLIEKGFKVIFEDKWCMIKDAKGRDVFKVKMRAKSFALNLMKDEQIAFSSTVKRDKLDKKAEPGVFIGYSNSSKAYRIFQPQNGKILVSRDVKFMEDRQWNWEESINMQLPEVPQYFDEDIDDVPVREAEKDDKWIEAMKEELRMIEKNDT